MQLLLVKNFLKTVKRRLFGSHSEKTLAVQKPVDGFQLARQEHAQYIFDAIVQGAKDGHFNPDYMLEFSHPGLRDQICTSIASQAMRSSQGVTVSFIYVLIRNNAPVGFSWVVQWEAKFRPEYELYLLAVSPAEWKNGYGTMLLDESIRQFPTGTKFHARLYAASHVMLRNMIKKGFKRKIAMKQGARTTHLSYIS